MARDKFEVSPSLAKFDVPLAEFLASNPQYTQFITGAYIFSHRNENSQPRVLLLQRSLSDDYGGYWEGPGGSCEQTDATILSALAREVFEESGLHVSRVLDLVALEDWESGSTTKKTKAAKYSFLVGVHEQELRPQQGGLAWEHQVKVVPEEHEQFQWAREEEVREGAEKREGRFRFCGEEGFNFLKAFETFRRLV